MASVDIVGVGKSYGTQKVLQGIDIAIPDGEFVVLVGPSGCGKSSLLRMVAGLEEITEGTIAVGGRVVNKVPPKQRDIAMVFQNYALYPHMTVRENMGFSLKLRGAGKAEIEQGVGRAAEILGLQALLDRHPRQLSGGQRQRVAMGRAIVRQPQVFLFDEPLSNLDAQLRVSMRGEIKALHQRLGITAIYVTHDQAEAMVLGDRVVVMRKGAIAQIGTPRDIYFAPTNRFVAEFVGAANLVEGIAADGIIALPGGRLAVAESGAGPVVAMIRPESIQVVAPDEAELSGRVERVSFIGDRQRLTVSGAAPRPLLIDSPNTLDIKLGERVGLSIAPTAVRLLPGERV